MTNREKANVLNEYKFACEVFFRPIVQNSKEAYDTQRILLDGMEIVLDALGLTAEAEQLREEAYKESLKEEQNELQV